MNSNSLERPLGLCGTLAFCLALAGCASYHLNQPLSRYDPQSGYRFPTRGTSSAATPANSDSLFICLTFSGGGTRAAAFAYGVLEKLKNTPIVWEGRRRSLLAEVDCISGVSGGSFTAAYYGLFGERLFQDFRSRFLDRDIQGELTGLTLNPLNWPRLASPKFNRIDLATELYDESVFDHKTFADLIHRGRRPFLLLNATNLATGERFEFTQDDFDFIGSDLSGLPVARAVAASSAFPFLLSPVTLRNYPEPGDYSPPQDVKKGLEDYTSNRRRWHWAIRRHDYLEKDRRPFVHLMDGGLSDNIGLRAIENAYRRSSGFIREAINDGRIKKLIIIVANARTDDQDQMSRDAVPPGLGEVGYKTATISLDNYSFETIESMRDQVNARKQTQDTLNACNRRLAECRPEAQFPSLSGAIEPVFIDLDFQALPDPARRQELLGLPTSFRLPKDSVDKLIRAGGELLENSVEFRKLRDALKGGVGE